MPSEARDDGAVGEPPREQCPGEQSRARDAGAVEEEPDEVGARHLQPEVRGAGRRGRSGIDARVAQVSRNAVERGRIDGLGRAVVDDDHLIVVVGDAALVRDRQRLQRARQLPRHVVRDHHDAQARQRCVQKTKGTWSWGYLDGAKNHDSMA